MAALDAAWRRMSTEDKTAMFADHVALRVRGRQDSKRWVAQLRARFARYDADGDGRVTLPEFRAALRAAGVDGAVAGDVFRQWDADGSGTLAYAALASALNRTVRRAANRLAHSGAVVRAGAARSARGVRKQFLHSVAHGKRDVSPRERRVALALLRAAKARGRASRTHAVRRASRTHAVRRASPMSRSS